MDFKIYTTGEAVQLNGAKFMLYGAQDVGKTTLLTTMPDVLIVATEEGLTSIKEHNTPFIRVTKKDDIPHAIKWLETEKNLAPFKSIALDSITYLTHNILAEIMAARPDLKEPRQWYGELDRVIKPFIMCILNLKKNVCITAWQGEQHSKIGNRFERFIPDAAGQAIMKYLLHFFDVTAHLAKHQVTKYHIDPATGQYYQDAQGNYYPIQDANGVIQTETVRMLQTREGNSIFARTRHSHLSDYEAPDLGALITKISSGA